MSLPTTPWNFVVTNTLKELLTSQGELLLKIKKYRASRGVPPLTLFRQWRAAFEAPTYCERLQL